MPFKMLLGLMVLAPIVLEMFICAGHTIAKISKIEQAIEVLDDTDSERELCLFFLRSKQEATTVGLNEISELYKASLDHLGKATDRVTSLWLHLADEAVRDFDEHAGLYVCHISDQHRKLIEEYEQAQKSGANDEAKRNILEKHFQRACDINLRTIFTESLMNELAIEADQARDSGDAGSSKEFRVPSSTKRKGKKKRVCRTFRWL